MAACLQHPLKGAAPADKEHDDATSLLGLVPHQIRGQVDNFQQHLMYGRAYDKCIACSASVVEAYEKQGFDFVASVLNEPELLEELTGLKAVKEEVDKLLEGDLGDMEAIDDEDEEWEM
jgi:ubiquitin-like modifier-activating enzyme ATG7